MSEAKPVSMCLPERSCPNDQFVARSVLETLRALVFHANDYRGRAETGEIYSFEYDDYWSRLVDLLRSLRHDLPTDIRLAPVSHPVREQLVFLNDEIGRIWLVYGLGEGKPGDDFPAVLMSDLDVGNLEAIEGCLLCDLNSHERDAETLRPQSSHSPDFRSVNSCDETFTFTANQAACVRALWEALNNGVSELSWNEIAKAVDTNADRLVDVFKGHKTWRHLIVSGSGKGLYRLAHSTQITTQITTETPTTA